LAKDLHRAVHFRQARDYNGPMLNFLEPILSRLCRFDPVIAEAQDAE
jgi:hypothetical protein